MPSPLLANMQEESASSDIQLVKAKKAKKKKNKERPPAPQPAPPSLPMPSQENLPEPYRSVKLMPFDGSGWYINAAPMEEILKKRNVKVVVELGSWLGQSTRHIAMTLPNHGIVYAIDHWKGNQEIQQTHQDLLPHLYDQFLSNVIHANLTEKIRPIRMTTVEAVKELERLEVVPDLVYVDASHDEESVYADLKAYFPLIKGHGVLCGDDWRWGGPEAGFPVRKAVERFARENRLKIKVPNGWFWVLGEEKIYDCFLFFNELELLKIRLEELDDDVDYFVLVESAETFRGHPKPFIFEENKFKFQKYLPKIIHIKVEERMPQGIGVWEREAFQRNCIARGLISCQGNDIILISDLDEIPRRTILPLIQEKLDQGAFGLSLEEKIYFFQLNRRTHSGLSWDNDLWFGTVATTYGNFVKHGAESMRIQGRTQSLEKIVNAGWHFTYMGNIDGVRAKIQSYSHGDGDISTLTEEAYQGFLNSHPAIPVDESFPQYIRDNLEYYRSIGFIGEY
jgi:beta-1,4-mannosyl-glycoprotein beta-1,4-N-acetylglucosaminyltransferase